MSDPGPAYLMLAHSGLARAGALAARLAANGAPVAVHLDRRVDARPFHAALGAARPLAIRRRATPWGSWALVEATLDGLALLRRAGGAHSHVLLLSGVDLPLRPEAELRGFLARHPGADFIESVDPEAEPWGRGGLLRERFTLRHPVSWRRRRLHDACCAAQRRFGLIRPPPRTTPPLVPHLGAQWWCLSRETADRILDAPDLGLLRRWFRLSFLPDESFFATMVRRVAAAPPDPRGPLTFARFDPEGRPYTLYDDHAGALEACDHFFARKLWPGAGLDARFPRPLGHARFSARPPAIDFAAIEARAETPPPGLRHPGRAPLLREEPEGALPRPCKALVGLDALWGAQIADWLAARCDLAVHGRVFAPDPPGPRFAGGGPGPGNLAITPALLREAPERLAHAFVAAHRGRIPALLLDPQDAPAAVAALGGSPMTDLLVLKGAWALRPAAPAQEAARRAERAERALIDRAGPGRLTLLPAREALEDPRGALARAFAAIGAPLRCADPPPPFHTDAADLHARMAQLRARGFDL